MLEVVTFRLMPERSAATFNEAVVRSTRFLACQSGFLRREVGAMERPSIGPIEVPQRKPPVGSAPQQEHRISPIASRRDRYSCGTSEALPLIPAADIGAQHARPHLKR